MLVYQIFTTSPHSPLVQRTRRSRRGSEVFCGLNQPHQWPLGPVGDSGGDNRLVRFIFRYSYNIYIYVSHNDSYYDIYDLSITYLLVHIYIYTHIYYPLIVNEQFFPENKPLNLVVNHSSSKPYSIYQGRGFAWLRIEAISSI